MKALDFFCGAGGLTRGLIDAGIDVVAGYDRDEGCRLSYESNNPGSRFVHADIREVGPGDLAIRPGSHSYDDVLFAGCAPCQPFSQQRKGEPRRRDATLLAEFGRLIEAALPAYVLMENVPGLAHVDGFSTFRRFLRRLALHGYHYVFDVLDAKCFGVPQNRRRLVLIAMKDRQPSLPAAKFGKTLRPFCTVQDAILHFPAIKSGESHPKVPNHVAAAISALNLQRLRSTPYDGGDRRSWPKRLRLECHKGDYDGHTDVYGRMALDAPAPTLTGRCNSISNGRYGHPTQDRAISLREAAALQTFPDGYEFFGFNKHIALQIGNAVPVRLAEELGRHILHLLRIGNGHTSGPCRKQSRRTAQRR